MLRVYGGWNMNAEKDTVIFNEKICQNIQFPVKFLLFTAAWTADQSHNVLLKRTDQTESVLFLLQRILRVCVYVCISA